MTSTPGQAEEMRAGEVDLDADELSVLRIPATRTQRYLHNAAPVGCVRPGQRFLLDTLNAFGRQFADAAEFAAFMSSDERGSLHHRCTGPIEVRGAGIDCSLGVKIHRIVPGTAVHCLSRSTGVLRAEFVDRECRVFTARDDGAVELAGALIRPRPSIGVIATTDDVPRSCGRCSQNGGNLDIPLAGAGSCVIVPVNHPDAGLVVGDVHLRQGAGEICGVAIEADACVELEVELREKLPYPVIETAESIAVVGWGTAQDAPAIAARNAIDYLGRQRSFAGRSDAQLYQLLAAFDLALGNLTGSTSTCAVLMPRAAVLDPVSRLGVFLAPGRLPAPPRPGPASVHALLCDCEERFEHLPLLHDGNSREIRAVPGHPELLVARLKDRVHSHVNGGPVPAPDTARLRAQINSIFCDVLAAHGIGTSTLAHRGSLVLMKRCQVAERIEVVVKAALVGSPRHRYPGIESAPTRSRTPLGKGAVHEPYVRFDWRATPPAEDQPMPRELADHFIDTAAASATALRAFACLREYLRASELDLLDACFFMNTAGDVVCGEVSPDNVTSIHYIGSDPQVRASFAAVEKSEIARRWSAILSRLRAPS